MGTIASGIFKTVAIKKQTALNTKAPAGAGGSSKYLRRVTSQIDLDKDQYSSNEINTSQQVYDSRHGVRSVKGSISGELSAGSYQGPFESLLRAAAASMGVTTAQTTIASTAPGAGQTGGTLTRSGGSFITDGWKVGDMFRMTGWLTTMAGLNSVNCLITTLSATSMTVICPSGKAFVTKAAADPVTLTAVGKKVAVPTSGHTRDYYTIEHFWSDIAQSEQFVDCVFSTASIKLPATGMSTVEFGVMGLDMQTGTAQYFTTPAAAGTGGLCAAVNGALVVNGAKLATVTSAEVQIDGGFTAIGGVVGSNIDPDVIPGKVTVKGTVSVLFDSAAMRDLFVNETESTLILCLTVNNTDTSDAIVIVLPSVKFGSADKDDGEKAITLTMPFFATQAVSNVTTNLSTTISIQDTLFT